MKSDFLTTMKHRRSIYSLGKEPEASDEQIKDILQQALKYTPTAHNTQLTRIVLLLRQNHDIFWDLVMDAIRNANPNADLSASEHKIQQFQAGYATVLYYNDTSETKRLIKEMPLYKNQFEKWAQHANAMLQFAVWNLLAEAGMGASLQHYNPLVDESVRKRWKINPDWELIAQMPLGNPLEEGEQKPIVPLEKRFVVFE